LNIYKDLLASLSQVTWEQPLPRHWW